MKAMDVRLIGQETEVATKATRRRFSAEYKRKIVKEADACKGNGDVGALLRREGVFSSQLANWRTARDRGELAPGKAEKKRGPKPSAADPRDKRIADLERPLARQTKRAEMAEEIEQIQKKVAALLGHPISSED
jgi:transposase